jgi:hypothetical protein
MAGYADETKISNKLLRFAEGTDVGSLAERRYSS